MAADKGSVQQIIDAEAIARATLKTPTPHEPTPQAPHRAHPGRDAALAEGRDPADPLRGKRPHGI